MDSPGNPGSSRADLNRDHSMTEAWSLDSDGIGSGGQGWDVNRPQIHMEKSEREYTENKARLYPDAAT